jgi:hypothetical protein
LRCGIDEDHPGDPGFGILAKLNRVPKEAKPYDGLKVNVVRAKRRWLFDSRAILDAHIRRKGLYR